MSQTKTSTTADKKQGPRPVNGQKPEKKAGQDSKYSRPQLCGACRGPQHNGQCSEQHLALQAAAKASKQPTCARCRLEKHDDSCEANMERLLGDPPRVSVTLTDTKVGPLPQLTPTGAPAPTATAQPKHTEPARTGAAFYVAPPGSGKSTLCRNDPNNIDVEVVVPPPQGRYWTDPAALKKYHDEVRRYLVDHLPTASPQVRFWYNAPLDGLQPHATYVIDIAQHRRNLLVRQNAARSLWTKADSDRVIDERPAVDNDTVFAVKDLSQFRTAPDHHITTSDNSGDFINLPFRPTDAQRDYAERWAERTGARVTWRKDGRPATEAHPHGITATARRLLIRCVIDFLVALATQVEVMIVGTQPHRWALPYAVYNVAEKLPTGQIDSAQAAYWARNSPDINGAGLLGTYAVCRDAPDRCGCRIFDFVILEHVIYHYNPETLWQLAQRTNRRTVLSIHHRYAGLAGATAGGEHTWTRTPEGRLEVVVGTDTWVHETDLTWLQHANVVVDDRRSLHMHIENYGMDGSVFVIITALHTPAPRAIASEQTLDLAAAVSANQDSMARVEDARIGAFVRQYTSTPIMLSFGFLIYREKDNRAVRLPVQLIEQMQSKLAGSVNDDSLNLLLRTYNRPYEQARIKPMLAATDSLALVVNRCAHLATLTAAQRAVDDEVKNVEVRQAVAVAKNTRADRTRVCTPFWLTVTAVQIIVAMWILGLLFQPLLTAIWPMPWRKECLEALSVDLWCEEKRVPYNFFLWVYYWLTSTVEVSAVSRCGLFDLPCHLAVAFDIRRTAGNIGDAAIAGLLAISLVDVLTGGPLKAIADQVNDLISRLRKEHMQFALAFMALLAIYATMVTCKPTWYGQSCNDGTWSVELNIDRWSPTAGALPVVGFAGAESNRPIVSMRRKAIVTAYDYQPHRPHPVQFCIGLVNQTRPRVFARCVHNEYVALRNRLAMEPPEVHTVRWQFFDAWVMDEERFEYLFPDRREFNKPDPVYWATQRNFSKASAAALMEALDDCLCNRPVEHDMYRTSMFVKMENGEPIEDHIFEDKNPRGIASSTPHYNINVGPFIYEAAAIVKECWDGDHYIQYAPGNDAVELGRFVYKQQAMTSECDYSAYDASRHHASHVLVRRILHRLGADQWDTPIGRPVTSIMRQGELMRGRSHHGIRYAIPGVLCSGRPDTSFSNSVIDGLTKFSAACYAGRADFDTRSLTHHSFPHLPEAFVGPLPPPPPRGHTFGPPDRKSDTLQAEVWLKMALANGARPSFGVRPVDELKYSSVVAGDDHAATHAPLDLAAVDEWDSDMGFTVKRQARTDLLHASFCSADWIPAMIDGKESYLLAPSWKRVVSRLGWTVNPAFNPHNAKSRASVNRGNALSLFAVSRAVPMLRKYIDTVLRLTEGVEPTYSYKDARKSVGSHVIGFHPAAYDRYNLTAADEDRYAEQLAQVTSLPWVLPTPWLSLSVFSAAWAIIFFAPALEEIIRLRLPWFFLLEVLLKYHAGEYFGAIISVILHVALGRVHEPVWRVLLHYLWNLCAVLRSHVGFLIVAVLLMGAQPADAVCSPAREARAIEHFNEAVPAFNNVTDVAHFQSAPFSRLEAHASNLQQQSNPIEWTATFMPQRRVPARGARRQRSTRRVPRPARRVRRGRRTAAGRQRARRTPKSQKAQTNYVARDTGGPLRRGFAVSNAVRIEKAGKAAPADTGESGTRFIATQELCQVALGASATGDQPCLKFGAAPPQSSAVLDPFLLADRVLQEAVMYDKSIMRQIIIDFIPLAGESVAGSLTFAIVEDSDTVAANFSGSVTRAKIQDLDNNKMIPVTRKARVVSYKTRSRSLYYVDSGSGEDGHFYAQLAIVGLLTGATSINTTYGLLQMRLVMDLYGRAPIQTLIQGDNPLVHMYRMRQAFLDNAWDAALAARHGEPHIECRKRVRTKTQAGACNACRFAFNGPQQIGAPVPLQGVVMYGTKADGSITAVPVANTGQMSVAISDSKGGNIWASDNAMVAQIADGGGSGVKMRVQGSTACVSQWSQDGKNDVEVASGRVKAQANISGTAGDAIGASGGAIGVRRCRDNGSYIDQAEASDVAGKVVLGVMPHGSVAGVATSLAVTSAGVLKSNPCTPAGTDLTTANGVATAITAIGTTTSAVSSGYLAVASATGGPLPVQPMLTNPQTGDTLPQAGVKVQGTGYSTDTAITVPGGVIYSASESKLRAFPNQTGIDSATPATTNYVTPIVGLSGANGNGSYVECQAPNTSDYTQMPQVVMAGIPPIGESGNVPRLERVKGNGALFTNDTYPLDAIRREITDEKALMAFDALVSRLGLGGGAPPAHKNAPALERASAKVPPQPAAGTTTTNNNPVAKPGVKPG